MSHLLHWAFLFFTIFVSFEGLGVNVVLNTSTFYFILFFLCSILYIMYSKKINYKYLYYGITFLTVSLISNMFAGNELDTFFASLVYFIMLNIPFLNLSFFKSINLNLYVSIIMYLTTLNIIIGMIQLLYGLYFHKPLLILQQSSYMIIDNNIPRLQYFMLEPAHFAILMTFIYVYLDLMLINNLIKNTLKVKYIKISLLAEIFLTFSFSGYFLLIIYFFYKLFSRIKVKQFLLFLGTIFFIYYLAQDYIIARLYEIIIAIQTQSFNGSAGTRINSAIIPFLYFDDYKNELVKLLLGEGYANYEYWTINYFSDLQFSVLKRGSIQNIFSVIFISVGLIGTIIYLYFFWLLYKNFTFKGKKIIIMLIVASHFLSGYLIAYWMFYIYYLGFLLKYKLECKRISNESHSQFSNIYNK